MSEVTPISKPQGVAPTYVRLLDEIWPMRLNANAIERIQETTGINLLSGGGAPKNVTDFLEILHAVALEVDPNVTRQQIGEAISATQISEVGEIITTMMSQRTSDPRQIAPYLPTTLEVMDAAIRDFKKSPFSRLLDLGCGDGRVMAAAQRAGCKHVIGFEIDAQRAKTANALVNQQGFRGTVLQEDIVDTEMSSVIQEIKSATSIFIYLLMKPMRLLAPIIAEHATNGTSIICIDFPFPSDSECGAPYGAEVVIAADGQEHRMFKYKAGAFIFDLPSEDKKYSDLSEIEKLAMASAAVQQYEEANPAVRDIISAGVDHVKRVINGDDEAAGITPALREVIDEIAADHDKAAQQ